MLFVRQHVPYTIIIIVLWLHMPCLVFSLFASAVWRFRFGAVKREGEHDHDESRWHALHQTPIEYQPLPSLAFTL